MLETLIARASIIGCDEITIDRAKYVVEPGSRESHLVNGSIHPPAYVADAFSVTQVKYPDGTTISGEVVACDFAHATVLPGKSSPIQVVNREGVTDYPLFGVLVMLVFRASTQQLEVQVFQENDPRTCNIRGEYHHGDTICCVAPHGGAEFLEMCQPSYAETNFTSLDESDARVPNPLLEARRVLLPKTTER